MMRPGRVCGRAFLFPEKNLKIFFVKLVLVSTNKTIFATPNKSRNHTMPTLTKKSVTYHTWFLDGEKVSLSFVWQITAKVTRRKSRNTRVENFEVIADSRDNAHDAVGRKFKGSFVKEIVSCTPSGIWKHSMYLDRPGMSTIPEEILKQIEMPSDL